MIEKSTLQSESAVYFDTFHNKAPHKLLFQIHQKLLPDQYQCTIVNYLGYRAEIQGSIILTNFRVIFKNNSENNSQQQIKFDFPIGYLSKSETSSETINKSLVFILDFHFKFGFLIKVKSANANLIKVAEHINTLLYQVNSFGETRAAELSNEEKCKRWDQYFENNLPEVDEAVLYDNEAWKYLPLYPEKFRVPKPFIGKRNQNDRIVLLSYVHEGKKNVGIWRSGPGKIDPDQQKWVPAASKKADHIVVDIKTKSLGANKSSAEQMIEMDGPIQLRQSFMKFFVASCYENDLQQQQQKWLQQVNFSKWYQQADILISQAFFLLDKISQGVNITILSDWDVRGSQLSALVQTIAKPENRTIAGFSKLIEKQFLHFGYFGPPTGKKQRAEDKGIALIQFFECVYQISKMYPLSFQFNEDMLTYIALHIYSRKYGNFLYLTRATNELQQQKYKKYSCIWAKIQKFKKQFTNPFFVDHRQSDVYELKRNVGIKNFRIWGSFFFRDMLMYSNNIEINQSNTSQRTLWKKHFGIKNETERLRLKISDQHKLIVEKRKQLKQLQKLQLD